MTSDLSLLCMIRALGQHRSEYDLYMKVDENQDYDHMAETFNKKGFFDCALGNALPLALSYVLKVSRVIMSSLEHYPVIPTLQRETPLSRIPLYIIYLRIGAGHYDAAIDNPLSPKETGESSCSPSTSKLPSPCQNEVTSKEREKVPIKTQVGCRCGRVVQETKEKDHLVTFTKMVANAFKVSGDAQISAVATTVETPMGRRM